jgi:hypothetical protein
VREDGGSYPELLKSEVLIFEIKCGNHRATKKQNRSVTKCQQLFHNEDFKHSRRELTQDWRCGRKATFPISKCPLACSPLRFYFYYSCSYLFSFKFLPLLRYFPLFRLRCRRSAEPSPREVMAQKRGGTPPTHEKRGWSA